MNDEISLFMPIICVSILLFIGVVWPIKEIFARKKFINKYGKPLKHFRCLNTWNTIPIRSSYVGIDFYDNFAVITHGNQEIILKKDYKDYSIYGTFLIQIFEVNNLQICITRKQKKYLEKFFDN